MSRTKGFLQTHITYRRFLLVGIYLQKDIPLEKDNDSICGVKLIGTSRFIDANEASMSSE